MHTADKIAKSLIARLGIVWQKNEEDIESLIKFDPVVRLFFHALIYQFEDVYHHLADFKKEILTNLGNRLLPDNQFFAMPAFGILKASPKSEITSLIIKPDKTFSTQRKIKEKISNLNFIPLEQTTLLKGELMAIASNNTLYDLFSKNDANKLKIYENQTYEAEKTIWLGLKLSPETLKSIDKIVFFINYKLDVPENKLYFEELLNAEWFTKKGRCEVSKGFSETFESNSVLSRISRLEMAKKRVLSFYNNNFITLHLDFINEQERIGEHQIPPAELGSIYQSANYWIKIKCNAAIPIDFFLSNPVCLNAFPVINCNINTDRLTKNEIIKNFKLEDGEHFFELFYPEGYKLNDGFVIRNTRYKTFDSKDLSMELRVLNRLFNQSRSLFENNNHLEEEEMNVFREFSNILSDLELRFENEGVSLPTENISSRGEFDRMREYKYTTTYGELGNGGEIGDLYKYDGPGLEENSIIALTKSEGGCNPLEESDTIDRFRYLLLSRDRIVTREDIKALTYAVFKEKNLRQVFVKQTTTRGIGKLGLHRAMKIEIYLKPSTGLQESEINFMRKELLGHLESKSLGVMPFLVEVNNS